MKKILTLLVPFPVRDVLIAFSLMGLFGIAMGHTWHTLASFAVGYLLCVAGKHWHDSKQHA